MDHLRKMNWTAWRSVTLRYALAVLSVTLAAGVVAIPIEPIPGLDVAYDTLVPIALLYYWIKFAWRVIGILRPRSGSTRPELGGATASQPRPSDSPHRLSPPPSGR